MAVTEDFAGIETVTADTWSMTADSTTIQTQTADGVYQAWVDMSTLLGGDRFQIEVMEKVQSAGTQRSVARWDIYNQQTDPIFVTPALMLMHGWDFLLNKSLGTDRSITWGIRNLGGVPTEYTEGSATMGATEFFIASESTSKTKQTSAGIYQLFLDLQNVAKSDVFEVKCTEEARAADTTEQVAWRHIIWGSQTGKAYASPALALMNGWEFSIDKIAGTDQAIPYSIRKLA